MRASARIAVVIPALNERDSIGKVIDAIPDWVDDIVVGDNGSEDGTAEVAERHGARVVREEERGYGAACLAALAALDAPDVVVFLDGDYSDYPEEMDRLVDPVVSGEAQMVIGSRVRGEREQGALTPQARFGNWLACTLMRLFWGQRFTDLGPFRAIAYDALQDLAMRDRDYGWTVEMQIKALRQGIPSLEVPVSYRKRIGKSKVSGTIRGVIGAGVKILSTIGLAALQPRWSPRPSHLVLFSRYPKAGKTKTRMIPALGAEGAAELQRAMTEHTLGAARALAEGSRISVEVRYAGGSQGRMRNWLGEGVAFRNQGGGDLGARMRRAVEEAFKAGAARVVLIGSDCPELTSEGMGEAFTLLEDNDLVLGPAADGGYYLIGVRHAAKEAAVANLFGDLPWGTDDVLRQTLARADEAGMTVAQLKVLHDVDRPEDLDVWERISRAGKQGGGAQCSGCTESANPSKE